MGGKENRICHMLCYITNKQMLTHHVTSSSFPRLFPSPHLNTRARCVLRKHEELDDDGGELEQALSPCQDIRFMIWSRIVLSLV